jgi:hypothetical protein
MTKRLKNYLLSLLAAIAIIPNMSRDFKQIKESIASGAAALDIGYYQRIFSATNDLMNLENFYVNFENDDFPRYSSFSLGEFFQRIGFLILRENIIITYFTFTLFYLTLWIYFLTKTISIYNKKSISVNILPVTILIMIFFGNNRIVDGYPFSRIISPQLGGLLWILGLYLITNILVFQTRQKFSLKHFIQFFVLVFVASFSYFFSFMALIGTGFVLVFYYFIKHQIKIAVVTLIGLAISSTPFFAVQLSDRDQIGFVHLSERLGLVHDRLPGSLTVIIVCSTILAFIVIKKLSTSISSHSPLFDAVMVISTLGILFASQSNVVTNSSLIFSGHFEIFIWINFILIFSFYLSKILTVSRLLTLNARLRVVITSLLLIYPISELSSIASGTSIDMEKHLKVNLDDVENIIVDSSKFRNVLQVYSNSRILYREDMYGQRISHQELLERYYISSGCDADVNFESLSNLFVYRSVAYKQRGESIKKYLGYFGMDRNFSFLYDRLITEANEREKQIKSEIRKIQLNQIGCIDLAKKYGVDLIVYDNLSNWNKVINELHLQPNVSGDWYKFNLRDLIE